MSKQFREPALLNTFQSLSARAASCFHICVLMQSIRGICRNYYLCQDPLKSLSSIHGPRR